MLEPVLDTLLLPFATGDLAWPAAGDILFLRARFGAGLDDAPRDRLICRQSYLPAARGLEQAGFVLDNGPESPAGPFPLILILPPRQREEARGLMAEAFARLAPGGLLVAAAANNEGARSGEADLDSLAGNVRALSKNKCRVFWAVHDPALVDPTNLATWAALAAPRLVADGRFWSRPGLFAWDRIDAGSALLATHIPGDLAGTGADLGCGYGYLAAEILARAAGVTALDLYDAEAEAVTLARRNIAPLAAGRALDFLWHDVTQGLKRPYDFIVSNPPFHVAREDRADLGQGFIKAASATLKPGGRFLLVANRHLPYEETLSALFARHRALADAGGYKVIEAVR